VPLFADEPMSVFLDARSVLWAGVALGVCVMLGLFGGLSMGGGLLGWFLSKAMDRNTEAVKTLGKEIDLARQDQTRVSEKIDDGIDALKSGIGRVDTTLQIITDRTERR
jgi:hypothetical protein